MVIDVEEAQGYDWPPCVAEAGALVAVVRLRGDGAVKPPCSDVREEAEDDPDETETNDEQDDDRSGWTPRRT
jgi:hypothetical protein